MTPQPPIDTPNKPTIGHAEYRKPELTAIHPDAFNALLVEKLREENRKLREAVNVWTELAIAGENRRWVSCADRLPGEGRTVLASDGKKVVDGIQIGGGRILTDEGLTVTHWRELPQPPST